MSDTDGLRYTKIPLNNGSAEIPALGFGTLTPDPVATKEPVRISLEVGFRQFDCADRYRNEEPVGEAMRAVFKESKVKRKDVFVGYAQDGPASAVFPGSLVCAAIHCPTPAVWARLPVIDVARSTMELMKVLIHACSGARFRPCNP